MPRKAARGLGVGTLEKIYSIGHWSLAVVSMSCLGPVYLKEFWACFRNFFCGIYSSDVTESRVIDGVCLGLSALFERCPVIVNVAVSARYPGRSRGPFFVSNREVASNKEITFSRAAEIAYANIPGRKESPHASILDIIFTSETASGPLK